MKYLLVVMALAIVFAISVETAAPLNATTIKPGNNTQASESDLEAERELRGVEKSALVSPGKLILPANTTESSLESTTGASKNDTADAREARRLNKRPRVPIRRH